MSFMVPEYKFGNWYVIETSVGTEYIPEDLIEKEKPTLEELEDYLEGEAENSYDKKEGWGVRLQAPGYLDTTQWTMFETEQEARDYVEEFYEVDPDSGESFDNIKDLSDYYENNEEW